LKATDDYADIIIRCGSDTYYAHKLVVCSQSDFFRNAFKGGFKEGKTNEISVQEDQIVVYVVLQYLYSSFYDNPPSSPDEKWTGSLTLQVRVYSLADQWFIPSLKDYVCDKKLESAYYGTVKRCNGEDAGSEELWIDLFTALQEAYSRLPHDSRVRASLLNLVALNCHLAADHASFKRNFANLVSAQPEFGTDLMLKIMASGQVYMSALENAMTCSRCKEGAIWIAKKGREPPKFCPFCGNKSVNQKGKDVVFSQGKWSGILPVSMKRITDEKPVG